MQSELHGSFGARDFPRGAGGASRRPRAGDAHNIMPGALFAAGHIHGSINLSLAEIEAQARRASMSRRSTIRSITASISPGAACDKIFE